MVLLGSEASQVQRFGKPSNLNYETWFSASSYLAYGSNLWVLRAADTTGTSNQQSANSTANSANLVIANTAGVSNGYKLFYSSNTAALSPSQAGGVYANVVSTANLVLSTPALGTASAFNVVFRSNLTYTAFGAENPSYNLNWPSYNILNANTYTFLANTGGWDPSLLYAARYPGSIGNSLRVAVCDNTNTWSSNLSLGTTNTFINATGTGLVANIGNNTLFATIVPAATANGTAANVFAVAAQSAIQLGDYIQVGNSTMGFDFMYVTAISNVAINATSNVASFSITTENNYNLYANISMIAIQRYWEFYNVSGSAPAQSSYQINNGNSAAQDQLHVVVVDANGAFSGSPGTVLEVYKNVSRATDAINPNGTTNYYKQVINQQSAYVWHLNDRTTATSNTSAFLASSTATKPLDAAFFAGDDGLSEGNIEIGTIINGYDFFADPVNVDVGLVITGKARGLPSNGNTQLATWLINNISSIRRDCVTFCSPDYSQVVYNSGFEASAAANARNAYMPSNSYGFMDSGYKLMYDQYNNLYRYVPLNGDMAGLCAQTDQTNAPWWSPAGFNRGNVKNVVQLSWNPTEPERDILYNAQINPVVQFPGQGTILFGDKTLLNHPSAFNRINVRRLFIILEKAISTSAKFFLFEFNDSFTRMQFKSMVLPFLADIQAQRGILAYDVRCDATNNPGYIIQNNQFVADIFILPNYSINWISLNFVNVPPTISFSEAESIQY